MNERDMINRLIEESRFLRKQIEKMAVEIDNLNCRVETTEASMSLIMDDIDACRTPRRS